MNTEAVIIACVFVLFLYLIAWMSYAKPRPPKFRIPKSAYHQELGRAGDSVRRHKPKRNIHRIINRLVTGEVKAFPPSAVIIQQKQYPDVSFWQGLISWEAMRAKTDAIIIRAGQNTWIDSMFAFNYAAAKMRGMLRGVYWFYDDRVSPGEQAAKLVEALGDDVPEMEIWCDWERSYGGSFGGLRNVVAFMEAVEREYPSARVGMYTGFYWFSENSNVILNFFQYEYLRKKPLWLAWYTSNAAQVLIPAPWTKLDLWQFGTPAVDWGQASAEIDMNYHNGTISEFYQRYAVAAEPPTEEPGETMRYEATNLYPDMSLRDDHNTAGNFIRKYPTGSKWRGDEIWTATVDAFAGQNQINKVGDKWLRVSEVNGAPVTGWVAITHLGKVYCTYHDNGADPDPEPPAEVRPTELTVTLSDGSQWRASEFTKVS